MRKMIATWLGICMMFICSITVTAKTLTSDNMPENLLDSERCQKMEDAIERLEEAVEQIDNAKDCIVEASA